MTNIFLIRDFIRVFVHNKLSVDQNQGRLQGARRRGGEGGPSTPRLKFCTEHCLCRHNKCIYCAISIEICHPTRDPTRGDSAGTQTAFLPSNILTAAASVTRTAPMEAQFHYTVYKFQGIYIRHVGHVLRYLGLRIQLTMLREGLRSDRLSGYIPAIIYISGQWTQHVALSSKIHDRFLKF